MSTRTRRKRGAPTSPGQPAHVPSVGGHVPTPMPVWKWRTFPVYFAFAVGGFAGLYMGLLAGATSNSTFTLVAFAFWAILLGFGFSRLTSAWMVSRGWSRARTTRPKR